MNASTGDSEVVFPPVNKPRKITQQEIEDIRKRFSEQMDQIVDNLNNATMSGIPID